MHLKLVYCTKYSEFELIILNNYNYYKNVYSL